MAKITGATNHLNRLGRMAASRSLTDRALYAAGQLIEIEMETSITAGSVSGAGHVASKPGEPPNADTRQLDTSIDTVAVGPNRVDVVVNDPKGVWLEWGTARMEARPFAGPAANKKTPEAVELVRRAVAQSTR